MFKNAKYILLTITLVIGKISFAQSDVEVDFTHLTLKLDFEPEKQKILGEVDLKFDYKSEVDSIYLNGIRMNYERVKLNGKKAKYHYDTKGIWISSSLAKLGESNTISIEYSCNPRKGIYFIGWDDETGTSAKQIWTQGQGIDHRHWIPHRDDQTDKLITELIVRFDKDFEVVSNGKLLEKEASKKETQWHYKMPDKHSSYLIMLAVGEYDKTDTQSKTGIPLTQYYYPNREDDYRYYYKHNEEIFNFFESEIGIPYPWESYAQVPVKNFRHGAMENTTATIFGDFFMVDSIAFNDRNYTYVNAHELAHQWFGNLVTASGSEHHWLHEGFATYYQWLSEKNLYGQSFFDWMRYKEAQLVFQASSTDSVPLGNKNAGSSRFYQKGAWVLYMLHHNLGDELYKRVIKHYLKTNAYGIVDLETLDKSIKEISGAGASDFFRRWVIQAGEPKLKVSGAYKNDTLFFEVNPLNSMTKNNFKDYSLPVNIYFEDGSEGSSFIPIEAESYINTQTFAQGKKVKYWLVNPNMDILAEIEYSTPYSTAKQQYKNAPALLDKYFAIKSIREVEIEQKESFLTEILEDEMAFYPLRAEALTQLTNRDSIERTLPYFKYAFSRGDIQLKKEAIHLVSGAHIQEGLKLQHLLNAPSYELRESALGLSLDWENPNNNRWIYDYDLEAEPGIPGRGVEIGILLYKLILFKEMEALEELKLRTTPAYDFMTRMNAIDALQAINFMDKELLESYFLGLFDYNWKLVRKSREALKKYYATEEGKKMMLEYIEKEKNTWEDFKKRNVSRSFGLKLD